jgi:hypothetical protein
MNVAIRCDARHAAGAKRAPAAATVPVSGAFASSPRRIRPAPDAAAAHTRGSLGRRKDLKPMQTKTALAVAGSVLAVPSTVLAATPQESAPPGQDALRASGRLTLDADHKAGLVRRNVRLARRAAHLGGHRLRTGYTRRVRDDSVSVIRIRNKRLHRRVARLERGSTASAPLEAIAACESGGNPSTNTGNGFYGKYQFTMETWQSVGGTGNPAAASEAEQDRRAARLYAQAGSSPWPVCGR